MDEESVVVGGESSIFLYNSSYLKSRSLHWSRFLIPWTLVYAEIMDGNCFITPRDHFNPTQKQLQIILSPF